MADLINDGGPAFPHLDKLAAFERHDGESGYYADTSVGMSLRDYFAAKAPIPDEVLADAIDTTLHLVDAQAKLAHWCYAWADAMLAERARVEGR